jgi:hypothetical protein
MEDSPMCPPIYANTPGSESYAGIEREWDTGAVTSYRTVYHGQEFHIPARYSRR